MYGIFFSQCNFHWLPPLAACLKQPVFSIPNLMSLNAILHELFSFLISQLGRLFAAFLMKWCILISEIFCQAIVIQDSNKINIISRHLKNCTDRQTVEYFVLVYHQLFILSVVGNDKWRKHKRSVSKKEKHRWMALRSLK